MANPILEFARRLSKVERTVRDLGNTSQLAHSSIEDGAVRAYTGDSQTMTIGRQWDGTWVATSQNGPVPPTPVAPAITEGIESIVVRWNGLFELGAIAPMDFLRVDIHIGTSAGFTADHTNRRGSILAPAGGEVTIGLPVATWYVKLVCWSYAGVVSAPSAEVEADSWPVEVSSDGFAPASSPAPSTQPGIDSFIVKWTPIINFDPVTYYVHVGLTTGFTPSAATLVGQTPGSQFTVRQLPGDPPAEGEPDLRKLQFDTDYFVKIVAGDEDGNAAASAEAVATVFQVPSGYIAADAITTRELAAQAVTASHMAAEMVISTEFMTAETGQRVTWGVGGIQGFRSDNTRRFNVPTSDEEDIFLDAQIVARGLQVKGGASFEGVENEITKDGALRLANGVSPPAGQPQMSVTYDSDLFDTTTVVTDDLGSFSMNPAEVAFIVWNNSLVNVYQVRPTGTRIWRYTTAGALVSTDDFVDWLFYGETFLTGTPQGFILFKFIPNSQFYVYHSPIGFNTYTPSAGYKAITLGGNGTDFFIAEINSSNQLQLGYRDMAADGQPLPGPSSSVAFTGTAYGPSKITVLHGNFDYGAARYVAADSGGASAIRVAPTSGAWSDTQFFDSPTANKRGIFWDGAFFRVLGADGRLYRLEANTWDSSTTSAYWWGGLALRDTFGTTHETTIGPKRSIRMNKRSQLKITFPPLPYAGGPEDPNSWVFYGGVGTYPSNAEPANLYEQFIADDTISETTLASLATSGNTPSPTNTFPGGNPAKVRNEDETLLIDATAKIRGKTFEQNSLLAGNVPFWGTFVVQKGSDQTFAASSTTLQNDNNLLFTAEANAKYFLQILIFVTQTANATGADFRVAPLVPSGSWSGGAAGPDLTVGSTSSGDGIWVAPYGSGDTPLTFGLNGNAGIITGIPISIVVEIGATGGTCRLRFAQNTSTAGTQPTVKGKSLMAITRFA